MVNYVSRCRPLSSIIQAFNNPIISREENLVTSGIKDFFLGLTEDSMLTGDQLSFPLKCLGVNIMKRARKVVELSVKYKCLKELEGGQTSRKAQAEKLGVGVNTIGDWWKARQDIFSRFEAGECSSKRKYTNRPPTFEKADKALHIWFNAC